MNKTTVTQLVKYLETRLRVRLLNRTTRQFNVTADGAEYCERVTRILTDIEESETALSSSVASPKGRMRVDVPGVVGRHMLLPAMPSLMRATGIFRSTWAYPPNRHVSAKLRILVDWIAETVAMDAPLPPPKLGQPRSGKA